MELDVAHARLNDRGWLTEQIATRSASSIAREIGAATDTVVRALRLHGLPVRPGTALRRASRRVELDDAQWLSDRYSRMTANTIAAELGVAPSTVLAALVNHGIAVRGPTDRQKFRTPAELDDPEWLRARYATRSGVQIAAELGVSKPGVHKAMTRLGVEADGPWVRRDTTRLRRPAKKELEAVWRADGTIIAVARRFEVAPTTASVWLADVGIFVKSEPAISRSDMLAAIDAGQSINEIAADHRVSPRTVMVELRRHGLRERHRHRPRA